MATSRQYHPRPRTDPAQTASLKPSHDTAPACLASSRVTSKTPWRLTDHFPMRHYFTWRFADCFILSYDAPTFNASIATVTARSLSTSLGFSPTIKLPHSSATYRHSVLPILAGLLPLATCQSSSQIIFTLNSGSSDNATICVTVAVPCNLFFSKLLCVCHRASLALEPSINSFQHVDKLLDYRSHLSSRRTTMRLWASIFSVNGIVVNCATVLRHGLTIFHLK